MTDRKPSVQHITIPSDEDGQRFDRWFFKQFPSVPKSHLYKLIRTGQIRVNGKRIKADTRLVNADDVRIPTVADVSRQQKALTEREKKYIRSLVIYEDADIIAIDKPYGLASQGGTGMEKHVDYYLDGLMDKDDVKPRLVHRLDRETSGVMILARSAEAARAMGNILKSGKAQKYYWALTSPAMPDREGIINAPLIKGTGSAKEKIIVDREEGKPATTAYKVIENAGKNISSVCFLPKTGRTHQIRVHASSLGAPILGDRKYGLQFEREDNADDLSVENEIQDRLYLHAARFSCNHPSIKEKKKSVLDIKAPLPKEMKEALEQFGLGTRFPE